MELAVKQNTARTARTWGFTLLELMITMAMLVLCVVPVMQLMAAGIAGDDAAERQTIALTLVQEKMEEIKNAPWGDLPSYAANRDMIDEAFSDYEREVVIEDTPEKDPNLQQVTVTVYWNFKGVEQQVSLVTVRTNLKP